MGLRILVLQDVMELGDFDSSPKSRMKDHISFLLCIDRHIECVKYGSSIAGLLFAT